MTTGDEDPGLARLAAAVPSSVYAVCEQLIAAGHEAVTVGGAVRDALLDRPIGDWDVATSAHPEQVTALFRRTIPTGLAHGTVTVMAGRGDERMPVEVTTYRGDGAYVDGRRPTSVVFGVPLVEDLARRDLVVNAIAYDPVRRVLHDPFDGRGDLAARVLRAVGDPVARFTEDGLRTVRAVRFAATLDFALDPATEAGVAAALPSLAKVSRERVKVELDKLLAAPRPSVGLVLARRTGILAQVLPEADLDDAGWPTRCAWIDATPTAARWAALLADATPAQVDAALRRLKSANDERERAVKLVRGVGLRDPSAPAVRRTLAAIGRPLAPLAVALWRGRDDDGAAVAAVGQGVLDRGEPLATGELAVTGAQLLTALGLAPGPAIGRALAACLEAVLDEPARNTPEALVELARAAIA